MRHFVLLCSIVLLALCHENYGVDSPSRKKRDDASFFSDVGGPVAREKSGASVGQDGQASALVEIEPCEIKLQKQLSADADAKANVETKDLFKFQEQPARLQKQANANQQLMEEFRKFCERFNKPYYGSFNQGEFFNIFTENKEKINELTKKRFSPFDASIDVTKFADKKFPLFRKMHTGGMPPLPNEARRLNRVPILGEPRCKKLQWTSKNVFQSANDQKECGSCYAVATSDFLGAQKNVESKVWRAPPRPLSAQYFVDCTSAPAAYGCSGGRPLSILKQFTNCEKNLPQCNVPYEMCYQYTGNNQTCKRQQSDDCQSTVVSVAHTEMLDISGPLEKLIMSRLLDWGPVIAIVGVTESWQFYNGSGIIRPHQCSDEQSHAVLITGYDYTTCVPTYTVRNSWGNDWGAEGYLKIQAGKNTCGVAKSVIYACVNQCGEKDANFDYISQHPNFPAC